MDFRASAEKQLGLTHYTNRTSCELTDHGCFKPVGAQGLAPLQWTVTPS
jgi:hypothetical protein